MAFQYKPAHLHQTRVARHLLLVTRNLKRSVRRSGSQQTTFDNKLTDGVLIMNMATWEGKGQPMGAIVDYFAERLAMAQQAIDTNLLYANMPYIFPNVIR
jgi:hypothetical protein